MTDTDAQSGSLVDCHGFYHVCFVVPDLEKAMKELTDMVGVRFGVPIHSKLGPWPYSLVFTDRAPHIELVSSVQGSPWGASAPAFHHLGWWTSCLPETIEAWTGSGGQIQFDGREHGRRFAYVEAPHSGARLEAVDVVQRPDFLAKWATFSGVDAKWPRS